MLPVCACFFYMLLVSHESHFISISSPEVMVHTLDKRKTENWVNKNCVEYLDKKKMI